MNAQPYDVHAIITRIEKLEQQIRRLKRIVFAGLLALAAVVLTGALSAGGQQGKATVKRPGFIPVPQQWRMPDGRVVEFPASTGQEEIDALAKRIADGGVELPQGAKVIGWEPVEGESSLLPQYAERVASIPTTKGKLDALANAAGILQAQINSLNFNIQVGKRVSKFHHDGGSESVSRQR